MTSPGNPDLLGLTAELVDIPSVSRHEAEITAVIQARLGAVPWLSVDRVGDNLVARTQLGRPQRLILAGHTDTVPPHPGEERADVRGDLLTGVGSADMKGGLAVMLALAETVAEPAVDLTFVFYAREEVASAESGLEELFVHRPDLLVGDAAILGEPTGGVVEAGCQGSVRVRVALGGARAHTARPWMGRNAIHRLGELLAVVAAVPERRPVLEGCEYREALQAVAVEGGVATNVVPDHAAVVLNHRFAPDRDAAAAIAWLEELLAGVLEPGDEIEVRDVAEAASPGLDHPLLGRLIADNDLAVRAKLGWTDVARFASRGVAALNLGPGDPELAHTAGEHVRRGSLEAVYGALASLVSVG